MKKLLKVILILCTVFAFTVTAYSETMSESYDWVYRVKDDGTAVITVPAGAAVNESDIIIPSVIDGYKVTEIGNYCFSSQTGIFTAEIPASVTVVGSKAFSDCYGLSTVSFGLDFYETDEGTQVIGDSAFMNCYGLMTVYFPTTLKVIEANAFSNCAALTSVNLPYGTEIIGDSAFVDCSILSSVVLPATIKELGKDVFDGCSHSMKIYYGGTKDEWTDIKKDESYFKDIEVIFFSEDVSVETEETDTSEKNGRYGGFSYNVMTDGTAELTGYYGGEEDVVIPSEVKGHTVSKIGYSCFSSNRNLRSVEIPSSVRVIEDCFTYCSNLETVTLHEGLEIIEKNTFKFCEKLENITLPSTVSKIGDYAFGECEALTEIVIHDNVLIVGERAFSGCEELEKIYLGKNITKIGEYCFQNCKNISRIEIPDGIISIERGLFSNCKKLSEVVIPVSVSKIEDHAFYGCYDLENVFYCGTEQDWKNVDIDTDNRRLKNSNVFFNYDPESYQPAGPVFAIVLCSVLVLASVAVVIVLMCRKTGTCPDCGKKFDENSEFCGWCGKKL